MAKQESTCSDEQKQPKNTSFNTAFATTSAYTDPTRRCVLDAEYYRTEKHPLGHEFRC